MYKTLNCSEIHCGAGINYYHQGMIEEAIDAYHVLYANNLAELRTVRESFYAGS